jgi:hypothetical protein
MLLAHGIGTRSDLPVPIGPAAAAAAAALVISFAVMGLLWRRPRAVHLGRPLPAAADAAHDHPALRRLLQFGSLLVMAAVVVVGFAGPIAVSANLAPWAFYIIFWVGTVPASLLFGPVLRVLNPLRLLHSVMARLLRVDPGRGVLPLPAGVGYWPAAVSLTAFGWLELVYPARAEAGSVATFVAGYAAVHLVAGLLFGRDWFARCDGFEVYSTLLGSLAPLGRLPGGRLGWRNPLDGLDATPVGPGLVGVVVALVGTTAYDGLSRTLWWTAAVPADVAGGTLGLLGAILAVGVVYLLGSWAITPAVTRSGARPGPAAFATTLAPIAAGYAVAHYFTLLLFDGQQAFILASDPFGDASDLLGLTGDTIDYRLIGPIGIMTVQLSAIVAGHLVATVAAHDRAVRFYPSGVALRTQYPMLAAMVALTVGAVGLLFAA